MKKDIFSLSSTVLPSSPFFVSHIKQLNVFAGKGKETKGLFTKKFQYGFFIQNNIFFVLPKAGFLTFTLFLESAAETMV